MDSFLNTQGSLGSSMSCSDTSYSSENSVTSSRDTSPDLPHDLLSKLNLSRPNHSNHVTSVTEMERSLFHIGSEQADRANANTEGDDRITTLGRSFRTSSTVASAGISLSTNWRDHAASSNSFGLAIDSPTGEISTLPSPTTPPGFNRFTRFGAPEPVNMLSKLPDTLVSDHDMDRIYGYCYDRGDGQYTRLVPVDMLPPLKNIPPLQGDRSGLIVLPTPRMPEPNSQLNNGQRVQITQVTSVPPQPDLIQSRIDNIIASSPPPNNAAPKKIKIYCDKWIHDGTCAFTQQGCKYKHEMPTDKETQEKLGLFHGYPAWWKKLQADKQRPVNEQSDAPIALPPPPGRGGRPQPPSGPQYAGSWRRIEPVHPDRETTPPPITALFYSKRGPVPAGRGSGKLTSPFGPIAPPPRGDQEPKHTVLFPQSPPLSSPPRSTIPQSNPYALLGSLDPHDNDQEDEEPEQGAKLN